MDHLQRLRYVTERYEQLQGLRLVPLGIPFLLSSAWRSGHLTWVPWTTGIGAGRWFVMLMASAVSCSPSRRHTTSAGSVTAIRRDDQGSARGLRLHRALHRRRVAAACSSADCLNPGSDHRARLGYVGMVGGPFWPHYVMMAVCVALFAALGALGVSYHMRDVPWDQLIGLIRGRWTGDHLLLRRTLVPVPYVNAL